MLGSPSALGVLQWDLLKGALDKGNGRVSIARKKLTVLRKEDDDTRARAIAEDGASMEVDTEAKKSNFVFLCLCVISVTDMIFSQMRCPKILRSPVPLKHFRP